MATNSTTVGAVASPPPTTAVATAHNPLPPPTDVLEERLIDEEYKVWKKNTPFLYDYVMTHSLEWPSLTCQWLPTTRRSSTTNNTNNTNNNNTNNNESLTEEHQLLIGTHTTGEQNYLMVASCLLPRPQHLPSHEQQQQQQQQEQQQQHGDGTTDAKSTTSQRRAPKPTTTTTTTTAALEYDHDKGEMGGYGMAPDTPTVGKITIHHKIPHGGEVNRARYMPQNPFVVASRGPNPDIYIWDRSKHPSLMTTSSTSTVAAPVGPQAVCVGHEREGYGMVWSVFHPGHLATASEDKTVRVWDVSRVLSSSSSDKTNHQNTVAPLMTLRGHEDTVEDVDWHYKDPNLLVSVGGDRRICLWDRAHPQQAHFVVKDAHLSDINSVAFNPFDQHIFATGSSDQTIGIWDVRRLDAKLHSLENVHTDDVFTISWAPFHEAVLASGSADRRVAVWDLTRVGHEQSADDAADGPPELLFLHGGHTSKVSDVAWNPQAPWTLASTSEDNILQIWSMAEEIYTTPSLTAWDGIGASGGGGDDNDAKGLARHELE